MDYQKLSNSAFFEYSTRTKSPIQHIEEDSFYDLFIVNGGFGITTTIQKTEQPNPAQVLFETGYKASSNRNDLNLKHNSPFASKQLASGERLFKRIHGVGPIAINANEIADLEIEIPYPHAKIEAIEILGQTTPVKAELFVEDSDAGTYSGVSRSELNQFGFGVNTPKDFYRSASKFDADLYLGMWVVVQITNNSGVVNNVSVNFELNEVRA